MSRLNIWTSSFYMLVLERTSPQFGVKWISLLIGGLSKKAMFEQTFLYFQLELFLFPVTKNIESIAHFVWPGLVLLLSICLSSLYNKDINSGSTACSHATNVFLHLFACLKTWSSWNLKAVSHHHKTLYFQLTNAQKIHAHLYAGWSKT